MSMDDVGQVPLGCGGPSIRGLAESFALVLDLAGVGVADLGRDEVRAQLGWRCPPLFNEGATCRGCSPGVPV